MSLPTLDPVFNLLIIVTFIALLARRFRLPYTVVLVFAGLLIPLFPSLSLPDLSPEFFMSLLLPPIVFEAAYHLGLSDVIKEADVVLSFAFVGTLLSTVFIAGAAHFILHFDLIESLLLGIIISPTDPVAVIATFRRLGVSERFSCIVEGEALLNDGVAIVFYSALLTASITGRLEALLLVRDIVYSILGGCLIGAVGGYLVFRTMKWSGDRFVHGLLTFLSAYGIYRIAEIIEASGVIAVVLYGLTTKYMLHEQGDYLDESNSFLDAFWEFIAFIATSIAFLFIGLDLDLNLLQNYLPVILASIAVVLGARRLIIYSLAEPLRRIRKKDLSHAWQNSLTWAGLKGAVSVVLALGVADLPLVHSDEILAISFGVVLFSLLVQGLSISFVIKKLGLAEGDSGPS